MRRSRAWPSKMRLGSFSSRVSSSLAAFLSLASTSWTRQTSRLFLRPYLPTTLSSESSRSFSKGRLGVLQVLEQLRQVFPIQQHLSTPHSTTMISLLWHLIVVLGGTLGYVQQYRALAQAPSLGAFSPRLCLILLLSHSLRVFSYHYQSFSSTILQASFAMILVQILLLSACARLYRINQSAPKFWEYHSLFSYIYVQFLLLVVVLLGLCYFVGVENSSVFQGLSLLSAGVESTMCLPQLINNYKTQSVKGLSTQLIGAWTVGDLLKSAIYVQEGMGRAYLLGAGLQLSVDGLIWGQYFTLRQKKEE